MAGPNPRAYDKHDSRGVFHCRIGTHNGTIAAAANKGVVKVPPGINGEVVGWSFRIGVGGTVGAAGPPLTINRSLAGTGTAEPIGTMSIVGTNADGKTYSGTATTTGTFLADDEIQIRSVAGTVALQLTEIECWVSWQERYV